MSEFRGDMAIQTIFRAVSIPHGNLAVLYPVPSEGEIEEQVMDDNAIDIYCSQNGDRWKLIRDDVSGRTLVRHEANQSSGGHRTDLEVNDFLGQNGPGPEYSALRRMAAAGETSR
jgi:hypothetical protein